MFMPAVANRARRIQVGRGIIDAGALSRGSAGDDVSVRALHDRYELGLLCGGNLELVESLLEVVEKGIPLLRRDLEVTMRVGHGAPGILLRPPTGPAHHFRHQVLEAGRWKPVVGFVDERIGVEARIDHDAIDEIVHDRCNAVDTTEPFVERLLWLLGGHASSFRSRYRPKLAARGRRGAP